MARSIWKGPFVEGYVLKKAEKVRESGKNEVIKIWSRKSTILPQSSCISSQGSDLRSCYL